jgi:uncharacterized protein (DUF488 family)
MANPFFTIGHSVRPLDVFVGLLKNADVRLVVDVRTIPRSRTNPQYNGDTLPSSLSGFGIAYKHIVELGGRRGRQPDVPASTNAFWQNASFHNYADYATGEDFRVALGRLRQLGHSERRAIMCAETLWWQCHRRIISDYRSRPARLFLSHRRAGPRFLRCTLAPIDFCCLRPAPMWSHGTSSTDAVLRPPTAPNGHGTARDGSEL